MPELLSRQLGAGPTAALVARARERGLTLNTVVQAAWGVLLGRLTGRTDVVFGATVAGRPPDVAGVESMIGLFINTVPVRVTADPAEPLAAVLDRVQEQQVDAAAAPARRPRGRPARGRAWASCSTRLLIFENYPADDGAGATDDRTTRRASARWTQAAATRPTTR